MKALRLPEPALSDRARRALAVAAALAIAPQIFFIPLWLSLPCLALAVACAYSPPPVLPKIWRVVLFIILASSLTMIALYFRRVWGREPGVSLLTVMVAAKLLEVKSSRDAMVVWCASAVLLVAFTTFDQEVLALAYMLAVLVALFALLDVIHDAHDAHPIRAHTKQAVKRLSLGVPLALILFALFPRLSSPLWGFSEGKIARTGLSESMQMGQISTLVKSDEVAFRVEFKHSLPQRDQLYWRGPVLDQFFTDGNIETWGTSQQRLGQFIPLPDGPTASTLAYAVTLQPHQQRWLFALDLPAALPKGARLESTTLLTGAQQLITRTPIREPIRYEVVSTTSAQYPADSTDILRNLSTASATLNPRARQWARETFDAVDQNPQRYVRAVLDHIRTSEFHYTTRPPLLRQNMVDDFWFNARRGFCEHYAGSFAFLMRAVGIPARIVTGYQGGELNPQNNLFVVRQSDAHAWTEIIIDGKWMRIDPTSAVAPQRIEVDLSAALPAAERNERGSRDNLLFNFVRHSWDAAQHTYTAWLLGYDRTQQMRALELIGLSNLDPMQWVGLMLLAGVASVLITIGLYTWRERVSRRKRGDVAEALWLRFLQRVRAQGTPLPAHVTPRTLLDSLSHASPVAYERTAQFAALVEKVRYNTAPHKRLTRSDRAALRQAYRAISFRTLRPRPTST